MRKDPTKRNHSAQTPRRTNGARWGKRALVVTCLITPMISTGCRSGKPGWNLFGRRGEPSAEMLAGSGPTLTYPAPPSAKATPEAIASIAGGTSPTTPSTPSTPGMPTTPSMGVPGMTPPGGSNPYALAGNQTAPPAYAIPGSTPPPSAAASASPTPSYAAAAANGYAAGGTPVASGTNSAGPVASAPATQTKLPSGYQLATAPPSATSTGKTSADAAPQSNGFVLPAMNSLTPSRLAGGQSTTGQTAVSPTGSSGPASSNSGNGGGFALPSGIVAPSGIAAAAATKTPPAASTAQPAIQSDSGTAVAALGASQSSPSKPEGGSSPLPSQASSGPEFQTATATKSSSADGSSGSVRPAGYTPGSTGASSGYPIQR